MNYKLSYNFEPHLNCGIIRFNDKYVLMDFSDLFSIINFEKNFIYYDPEEKTYPYYLRHNQKNISLNMTVQILNIYLKMGIILI